MGGGSVLLEIVIFAAVAAFFIYRLRSVLGRRHGEERERPNPYVQRPGDTAPVADADSNVVQLPDRRPVETVSVPNDGPISVAEGVRQIQSAEPNFSEKGFVSGARAAFEMIVGAFAAGDTPTCARCWPMISTTSSLPPSASASRRARCWKAASTTLKAWT